MKRNTFFIVLLILQVSACSSNNIKTKLEKAKNNFVQGQEKIAVSITKYKSWSQGNIVLNIYNDTDGIQAIIPITKDIQKKQVFSVSNQESDSKITYYRGKNIIKLLDPSGTAKPPSGTGDYEYQKEDAISGYIKVEPISDKNDLKMIKVEFKYLVFPKYKIENLGPIDAYVGLIPPT